MTYQINLFSSPFLQDIEQCDENEENTFPSPLLIQQIASVALGTGASVFIYRIRNNPPPFLQKFYDKVIDLGRACYHTYQHQRILSIINTELKIWEQLRDLSIETTQDQSIGYDQIRKHLPPNMPAATKVVTELFTRHVLKGPILELGSNLLNENGDSYLARLLPNEHRSELSYSDCLPHIVKSESKKTKRRYLCVDATQLHKHLSAASKTNVIALNVIDTLSRNKLTNVIQGIHHVLKTNGHMVILCDLPFDQNPLIDKFSSGDNLVFPYQEGKDLGIQIISRQAVMYAAQSYGVPFAQFMESLFNLPQKKRGNILFSAFAHRLQLCKVLEQICNPADVQRIDHKKSYIEDLTAAIRSHNGFQIEENGYFEGREVVQGTLNHPGINVVGTDLRLPKFIYDGYSPDLPKNHVLMKSVFHAVVAKKIK